MVQTSGDSFFGQKTNCVIVIETKTTNVGLYRG